MHCVDAWCSIQAVEVASLRLQLDLLIRLGNSFVRSLFLLMILLLSHDPSSFSCSFFIPSYASRSYLEERKAKRLMDRITNKGPKQKWQNVKALLPRNLNS